MEESVEIAEFSGGKPEPAMTSQQAEFSANKGGFAAYKELAVGNASFISLIFYELYMLFFSPLPGLLGLGFRSLFVPLLVSSSGKRPAIGRGVLFRIPAQIRLGDSVLVDDSACLDVRGEDGAINLGSHVSIGRSTTLAAKHGEISLASAVNVGTNCRLATQSSIEIGESTLVAAYCYIGPGNHKPADKETPLISQDMEIKGGVKIGSHCWIGTRSTILDGVTIGDGAIVGAHSLVLEDVPAGAVVAGSPARVIKS